MLTLTTVQGPPGIASLNLSNLPARIWVATLFLPMLFARRRMRTLLATCIATLILSTITGCTTVSYTLNPIAPGTYTIPVTAIDPATGAVHTTNLTLTIIR